MKLNQKFWHTVFALPAVLAGSGIASADTWVVDATGGPGSDFTDIQPAIDVSHSGDLILVLPGNYSRFTLGRAVEIIGYGGTVVVDNGFGPPSRIENVTAGARAVLADLTVLGGLRVTSCTREVVLDQILLPDGGFQIENSADVRMRACTGRGEDGYDVQQQPNSLSTGQPGLRAVHSRVEITESTLRGGDGGDCIPCQMDGGYGGDGGPGILSAQESEVHVARCTVTGGDGGDASPGFLYVDSYGGFGGNALEVGSYPYNQAKALVSGQSSHVFQGGAGGFGYNGNGQEVGAPAMRIRTQAIARSSGVAFTPGPLCNTPVEVDTGATHELAIPDDPSMRILSAPEAGQTTTLRVTAVPGAQVTMLLGRVTVIVPVPGLAEDRLVVPLRSVDLGIVGSSGTISMNQFFPNAFGVGNTFHAQALVFLPGSGEQRYTNSVPLILR